VLPSLRNIVRTKDDSVPSALSAVAALALATDTGTSFEPEDVVVADDRARFSPSRPRWWS
jgi:hypothetical protein